MTQPIRLRVFLESAPYSTERPCPEAFSVDRIQTEQKLLPCVESIITGGQSPWFQNGENHRMENGVWVRDVRRPEWFIEFGCAQQMLEFVQKHGPCRIEPDRIVILDCEDTDDEEWDA